MYPQDIQLVEDISAGMLPATDIFALEWDSVLDEPPSASDPQSTGIIICQPSTDQPAAFIAIYSGSVATEGVPAANPLDITASGRVTENKFTPEAQNYSDDAVVVFLDRAQTKPPQLLLPQDLQSTGDDIFRCTSQTGVQPSPGMDVHRVESLEPLLRRGLGTHPGQAIIRMATTFTNILDNQEATTGSTVSANMKVPGLNAASPVKAVIGADIRGRFFGMKLKGSVPDMVFRYLGAILRGRRET